jgi:hypothetical protein
MASRYDRRKDESLETYQSHCDKHRIFHDRAVVLRRKIGKEEVGMGYFKQNFDRVLSESKGMRFLHRMLVIVTIAFPFLVFLPVVIWPKLMLLVLLMYAWYFFVTEIMFYRR